jgi:hypothetical protein
MAKKHTPGSNDSVRRRTTRRAAATTPTAMPADSVSAPGITALSTASEMHATVEVSRPSISRPSAHEIAVAAYLRYLERGGQDGHDLDDWIQAENELRRLHDPAPTT